MVLCVQIGWFVGGENECSFVVVVGASASALGGQKGLCGSCLIRVTSMHSMESIRMLEDAVT